MPLTAKGNEIKAALTEEYGAKKGEQVMYAGKNKGTFTGIDSAKLDEAVSRAERVSARVDAAFSEGDHPREQNGQFAHGTHVKINSPGIRGHGESGHIVSNRSGPDGKGYSVKSPSSEYTNYGPYHEHQIRPTGKAPEKGSRAETLMRSGGVGKPTVGRASGRSKRPFMIDP